MAVEMQERGGRSEEDVERRRQHQEELVELLNQLLADFQVLYQKLRGYHWNVEGERFYELHEQFQRLYEDLDERIDAVAEQIRVLERRPLATYADYLESSRLEEDPGVPEAGEMVHRVHRDLQWLNSEIADAAHRAGEARSRTTVHLLEEILAEQVKTAWMLRSYLS